MIDIRIRENAMNEQPVQPRRPPLPEHLLERLIFASRWLLAPFYLGLACGLLALLLKFARELFALLKHAPDAEGSQMIIGLLSLIDLSLMASLVLMVILAGYE